MDLRFWVFNIHPQRRCSRLVLSLNTHFHNYVVDKMSAKASGRSQASKPKRVQVAVAYEHCRQVKAKVRNTLFFKKWKTLIILSSCDGMRPCVTCTRRKGECIYVTEPNETRQVAAERKFDELYDEHNDAQSLIAVLSGENEDLAKDAFCRLRAGHPPRRTIQSIRQWDVRNIADTLHERRLCQNYLIALLQSTASLWNIVQAASRFLHSGTRLNIPSTKDLSILRNYIITRESLGEIFTKANSGPNAQHLVQEPRLLPDGPFMTGLYFGRLLRHGQTSPTMTKLYHNSYLHSLSL